MLTLDEMTALQVKINAIYKKLEIEIKTKKVLEEIGFPVKEKGCVYLILAVKTAIKNQIFLQDALYETVSQELSIAKDECEREISGAIARWRAKEKLLRLNGKGVKKYDLFSESEPTNEEFIARLVNAVLVETKNERNC